MSLLDRYWGKKSDIGEEGGIHLCLFQKKVSICTFLFNVLLSSFKMRMVCLSNTILKICGKEI